MVKCSPLSDWFSRARLHDVRSAMFSFAEISLQKSASVYRCVRLGINA